MSSVACASWARAARVGLVAGGVIAGCRGIAAAHAPPQIVDVVERAQAGPILVTNRGLVLADSASGPFRLLCSAATATNTSEEPDLIVLSRDHFVVATARGLVRTTDGGCSFTPVEPLGDLLVPAAAADPRDARHFFVAAYDSARGGLFETGDGGETFEALLPASVEDFVATILVAPSRPERVYLEGEHLANGESTRFVAVSDDGGASFERYEVPLLDDESGFELLAVSPGDPDLIVGRAADADEVALNDALLVSRDRGASWTRPVNVRAMTDARFSADGETLWASGVDGVLESHDGARSFVQRPDAERISLALELAGSLWLCGYYDGVHDGIGRVGADGSVAGVFAFTDVSEPAVCPEGSPSAIACVTLWEDWKREVLGAQSDAGGAPPTGDAGALIDAGATPDAAPPATLEPASSRSGDGCVVTRAAAAGARVPALTALLALALVVRARARRRSRFSPSRLCARLPCSESPHALADRVDADRT